MKIRVLNDYVYEGHTDSGPAIEVGTVIDGAEYIEVSWCDDLAVIYQHPETGAEWISYPGGYEVVAD
jgi:hypothetical protein